MTAIPVLYALDLTAKSGKSVVGDPDIIIGAIHPNCRGSLVPVTDLDIEFDRPAVTVDFEAEAKRRHEENPKNKKPWNQLSRSTKTAKAYEVQRSLGSGAYKMVSERMNYGKWFNRQPAQFQRDVLGKQRFSLFKQGRYKVADFASIESGIKPLRSL